MRARIAIVGAGNLGARHLQALARLEIDLIVDVVDPSQVSRARSLDLLAQAGGLRSGSVNEIADIDHLDGVPDLAIVATNSAERLTVVTSLVKAGARRLILEKVLFTRSKDYDVAEDMFGRTNATVWVNCGRRFSPRAQDVAQMLDGKPFDYGVQGAGWGLGCNVIHHLDEFAMLAGCDDIVLSGEALDRETIGSKRTGYIEFTGTLSGSSANGSRFSAHCTSGEFSGREVTIAAEGLSLRISQADQTLTIANGKDVRTEPFPIPLQSEITARHVMDILEGRKPALPDYATAARLHRSMLGAFLSHLRMVTGNPEIDECPIT